MQRAFSLAAVLLTAPCLHANVATGNLGRLFEMDALPLPHDWVRQLQGDATASVGSHSFSFSYSYDFAPEVPPATPTEEATFPPSPAPQVPQAPAPEPAPEPQPDPIAAPVSVVSIDLELAGTTEQKGKSLEAIAKQLEKVTGKKGVIKQGAPSTSMQLSRALQESSLPSLQEIVGALCAMNTEKDEETIELEDYSDQAAVDKALTDIVDGTVPLTLDDGTPVRSTVCKARTTLRSTAPAVAPLDNNTQGGGKTAGLAKSYIILIAVLCSVAVLFVGILLFRRRRAGSQVTQV